MQLTIIPDIVKEQKIVQLSETASALDAAREMTANDIAAVVIVDGNGGLVGIVTERDMTRRVLAEDLAPGRTPVSAIMTRDPDTLAPGDSASDALELMRTRRYRHLPVVAGDRVVGMVSIRDLYAAVKGRLEEDIRETEAFVFGDR